jgi:hypothetical protein
MAGEYPSETRAHGSHAPWIVGRAIVIAGVAVATAYLVALLTLMTRWMNFWIRGPYYISYQALYCTLLILFLFFWLYGHHNGTPSVLSTVLFGTIMGYVAGLIAFVMHPVLHDDGWNIVSMSLNVTTPAEAVALLWFPARMLSWLVGGIAALVMVSLMRRRSAFRTSPGGNE